MSKCRKEICDRLDLAAPFVVSLTSTVDVRSVRSSSVGPVPVVSSAANSGYKLSNVQLVLRFVLRAGCSKQTPFPMLVESGFTILHYKF